MQARQFSLGLLLGLAERVENIPHEVQDRSYPDFLLRQQTDVACNQYVGIVKFHHTLLV